MRCKQTKFGRRLAQTQTNAVWKNEENICHDKGWGKIGKKIYGIKKIIKKRCNVIAAYVNKKILSPSSFKTTCTADVFNFWVKNRLIKELIPGQIVVMVKTLKAERYG